jgi:hypothetical protein
MDFGCQRGGVCCQVADPSTSIPKVSEGWRAIQARPMVCRCSPFLSPGQIGLQGVEIYEDCPASAESLKRIERDLDLLLESRL